VPSVEAAPAEAVDPADVAHADHPTHYEAAAAAPAEAEPGPAGAEAAESEGIVYGETPATATPADEPGTPPAAAPGPAPQE
jgi:hypothetical protein